MSKGASLSRKFKLLAVTQRHSNAIASGVRRDLNPAVNYAIIIKLIGMRAQLGSNPASMGSLGGAGVAQVNGLSSSQTNASNGASFGPLRYNPLFKEVDQELRKLKSQFDGIKDYQQQSSSELPRQPRTFVNSALIKPSTSSNELASSSTSI